MPLSMRDAQDAATAAKLEVQEWASEFVREWLAPMLAVKEAKQSDALIAAWDAMPPETHEMMKEQDPQKHAQVEKMLNQLRAKRKRG